MYVIQTCTLVNLCFAVYLLFILKIFSENYKSKDYRTAAVCMSKALRIYKFDEKVLKLGERIKRKLVQQQQQD